jgi:hypothetical protein
MIWDKREKPTDEDIQNAATDYIDEHLYNGLTEVERISKAYQMGARDMRHSKIYISPKDNIIGFDVLKRNSDIAAEQTIKAVKQSQREKQGAEEIIYKFTPALILSWIQNGHAVPPNNQKDLLNYMIAFVNNFAQSPDISVSDEEIEKEFPTDLQILMDGINVPKDLQISFQVGMRRIRESNSNKQEGAKWLRDKLAKQVK